jgi:hypothetical protein
MHIHDFHAKFVAVNEEDRLFEGLRNLSLVEDLKSLFAGESATISLDWLPWNSIEASAA